MYLCRSEFTTLMTPLAGAPQFRLGLWRAFADTKEWQTLFTEKPSPSAALPDTDTDSLPHTTSHTNGT